MMDGPHAGRWAGLARRRARVALAAALAVALAVALAMGGGAALQAAERSYVVRAGDSLWTIARHFGCSLDELRAANGIRGDRIVRGQTLSIPDCAPAAPAAGAAPAPAPAGEGRRYTIRRGDTLGSIAAGHGCSVAALREANALAGDRIIAGRELTIPSDCEEAPSAPAPTRARSRASRGRVDTKTLPRLMHARGFHPPDRFKGLVIEFTFDGSRRRVVRERWFDYEGTSDDTHWNAASTVKLYAAIAAMRFLRSQGFSYDVEVSFEGAAKATHSAAELLREALTPSNNIAYNRLVQLVGFDQLNGRFLTRANGFADTALRQAYQQETWVGKMGEPASFRTSPRIVLREKRKERVLPPRKGTFKAQCHGSACTTLADLAECMRRLMLQEQLPAAETYRLPPADLRFIRQALAADRARGQNVVEGLARSFPGPDVRFFHKPGFARDWFSDNVYVYVPGRRQAWIVSLAGYPGRKSLDQAARIVGEILASGELDRS